MIFLQSDFVFGVNLPFSNMTSHLGESPFIWTYDRVVQMVKITFLKPHMPQMISCTTVYLAG